MDLSAFVDSVERGIAAIPPVAIALVLLAGPTVALIGYRLVGGPRRVLSSPDQETTPLWVCHDCRSVNELRVSRCYRCGLGRAEADEIELVVDQPAVRRPPANVPAGSPFAAVAGREPPSAGVPVMADPGSAGRGVAVGPGRSTAPPAMLPNGDSAETADTVEARQ